MRILGICASPRIGGNSDILLEKALEGAVSSGAETEKIILNELNISPVQQIEYEKVNDQGLSVIEDDMRIVFQKIKDYDSLILAAPVFFGSLSTQAKMMIDRFQCVWLTKNMMGKDVFTKKIKGGFISVQATTREDFFQNARFIVRHFFATINAEYKEEIFCPGVDKKAAVLEHTEFIEKAYELGEKLTIDHCV